MQASQEDPEWEDKPCCRPCCSRVVFGFFLCVVMVVLGFIVLIVGGVQSLTAVILLGVVFIIGGIAFFIVILVTQRKSRGTLQTCFEGCPCCACCPCCEETEDKYIMDNTESVKNGSTANTTTVNQPTRTGQNQTAIARTPSSHSAQDNSGFNIETFELQ